MVLLEGAINSACNNRTVEAKMTVPNLYMASSLCAVKAVTAACAGNKRFDKTQLANRSKRLSATIVERWPIRKP